MATTQLTSAVEALQQMYGAKNATFDAPPSALMFKKWVLLDKLRYVVDGYREDGKRRNVHIIGESGIGKTACVLAAIKAMGIKAIYLPIASVDPELLGMPVLVPVEEALRGKSEVEETVEFRLRRWLLEPGEKICVFDEERQGTPAMLSVLMEIKSAGKINGVTIPDLIGCFVLDNPASAEYGDLSTSDLAQADRISTVVIDQSMTAWEYGLAQIFPQTDLTKVLEFYTRLKLSEESRRKFPPRVLEHIIRVLLEGFNASYGWPRYPVGPAPLTSPVGEDIRDQVFDKIAEMLGVPNPPRRRSDFKRALELCATKGYDILAYGDPGIGKTAVVEDYFKSIKMRLVSFSMPHVHGDEFSYVAPTKDGRHVTTIPRGELWSNEPTVALFDEATRGDRDGLNAVNELVNQHTIGGEELPNYVATVLLTNNPTTGSQVLDVNEITWAFATRPDFTFTLSIEDTGALEWLVETYGDDIVPFVEWFRMDLDDASRYFVSPRCLERMLDAYQHEQDLQHAIVYLEEAYAPVPLTKLYARLGGRPHISFLNLVEETADYEKRLRAVGTKTSDGEFTEAETLRMEVFMALNHAELPSLEANRKVCERMIAALTPSWRYMLLEAPPQKWKFWSDALEAVFPDEFQDVL